MLIMSLVHFAEKEIPEQWAILEAWVQQRQKRYCRFHIRSALVYFHRRAHLYENWDDLSHDVEFIAQFGLLEFYDSQVAKPLLRTLGYLDITQSPEWQRAQKQRDDVECLCGLLDPLFATGTCSGTEWAGNETL